MIEVFENVIPMSVKAAETSAEGKSIYMHCPKGKVAEAYMNLTQEVLQTSGSHFQILQSWIKSKVSITP